MTFAPETFRNAPPSSGKEQLETVLVLNGLSELKIGRAKEPPENHVGSTPK
jgi:hypothetical protein